MINAVGRDIPEEILKQAGEKIEAFVIKFFYERFEYGGKKSCSCFYNCGSFLKSWLSCTRRANSIAGRDNLVDFQ